jgi:hypothetical protein
VIEWLKNWLSPYSDAQRLMVKADFEREERKLEERDRRHEHLTRHEYIFYDRLQPWRDGTRTDGFTAEEQLQMKQEVIDLCDAQDLNSAGQWLTERYGDWTKPLPRRKRVTK